MTASDREAQPARSEGEVADVEILVGEVPLIRRLAVSFMLLVVACVLLLAVLFVARGAPVHGVVVEGLANLPSPGDSLFASAMELHTGAQLTRGNNVEILLNGRGTFPRLWDDIRSARRSITVQMYFATPGAVIDSLGANLVERARAGVRVLLLLDAFGARTIPRDWLRALREAGVSIAHLRPLKWYKLDRLSHRSHVRGVVIDGAIGYTGGFGFGDWWLGDADQPDHWRETNVRLQGPVVLQLQSMFTIGWAEATGELLVGDLFFPATPPASENLEAALMYFAPSIGSSEAERFLALSIATAKRTLYIANAYFVPDVQFRRMLVQASARGVDVRVLAAGEHTDVPSALYAARARYEELLEAGVRIYEYLPTMMHSKTIVVDGKWATIGSLNLDNRSLSYNDEANVVVLDDAVAAALDSLFLRDLGSAREIVLPEFRKRGAWQRFLEFTSNLISGLL